MRPETEVMHTQVEHIGRTLGLVSRREVSVLNTSQPDAYAPRLDVAWFLPLDAKKRAALTSVGAKVPLFDGSLIIAGWEIEGSDAPTRAMQADLANIRVSGAPYGFLALRGDTRDNLYARARNMARAQRHAFGTHDVLVLDTAWIEPLSRTAWSAVHQPLPAARGLDKKASGGETEWAKDVRKTLRSRGEAAGFDVWFDFKTRVPPKAPRTVSAIDVVWTLPMPRGLASLAADVVARATDPHDEPHVPKRFHHLPVVAFEVENNAAKHAHGALLNLASHALAGVFVGGDAAAVRAARAAHDTYRDTYPLARVSVSADFVRQATKLSRP